MGDKQVIVDGIHTHYMETGAGPVILYLHGWGSKKEDFDGLIAEIGSNYRHIALDLPGFGKTELPPEAWGVGGYAQFINRFLSKLEVQSEVLIGHSLGGRIIVKGVAEGIVPLPKKLVFLAAAGSAKRNTVRNILYAVLAKIGKLIFSIPPLTIFRDRMRKKLYHAAGSTDYLNAGHMKDTFLAVINENLLEAAKKISAPSLLIWGDLDTETPLTEGELLAQAIPNGELVILPGVGHYPHHEAREKVAAKIKAFLS